MSKVPELNAKLRTSKTSVCRVTLEDYSHLGGPMGTEYTTVLARYDFTDSIVATQFVGDVLLPAIGITPKADGDYREAAAQKLLTDFVQNGKASADLGAYGIGIAYTETETITGYDVVKAIPQTVSVGA
jgi:hypothetical protein